VAAHLGAGRVGEVGDPDVGDVLADPEGVAHRVARDAAALDVELERLVESDALDGDVDGRALGPAQPLGDVVEVESAVGAPSTAAITSPARRPTREAGVPSIGVITVMRPPRIEMITPMP